MAAAAAWNDDTEAAVKEVQKKLASLRAHCSSPAKLERVIGRAQHEALAVKASIRAYQRTAQPEAIRATTDMMQNIEDRLEAVAEYALLSGNHPDHEHVKGRVEVVQFARAAIDDMLYFFSRL